MSEANKYGFWMLIGYIAPSSTSAASAGQTTNFDYTAGGTDIQQDWSVL